MLFGLIGTKRNIQIVRESISVAYGFPLKRQNLEIPIKEIESIEKTEIKKKYKIHTTFGNRTDELDINVLKIQLKKPLSGLNPKQIETLTRNVAAYENVQAEKDLLTFYLLKEPSGGFDTLLQEIKKNLT